MTSSDSHQPPDAGDEETSETRGGDGATPSTSWGFTELALGIGAFVALAAAVAATWGPGFGTESPGSTPPTTERPSPDDSPTESALSVDTPDAVDLTGTWAVRTVQTALTTVPMSGEVESTTTSIYATELRQEGDRVTLVSEVCDTDVDSSFDRLETIVPDAFVETIPRRERTGSLRVERGGLRFDLPRSCRVRGAEVDDPADAPLPSDPEASSVVDADGDGHPGVTIRVEGMVDGELYMVQRGCDRYRGRVVSRDRIEGRLDWKSDRSILDTTHVLLGGQTGSTPHPDASKSRFVMKRLATDDPDCSAALETF